MEMYIEGKGDVEPVKMGISRKEVGKQRSFLTMCLRRRDFIKGHFFFFVSFFFFDERKGGGYRGRNGRMDGNRILVH